MIYPKMLDSRKTDSIIKIGICVTVFVAILLVIINRIITPEFHWAAIVNSGIVYVWVTVIYSINRNRNMAGHVLLQLVAIATLITYIDYLLGFKGWSINIGIPILIMIANITMLVLTIVSYKKYVQYAICQLIICAFSMLPIFFITEHMVNDKTLSIVATSISVINFLITLCLSAKDVKEAIVRNFHI